MDLATATPTEIDTRAAFVDNKISQLLIAYANAITSLRKTGDRAGWIPRCTGKRFTDDEIVGMALIRKMDGFKPGDDNFTSTLNVIDKVEAELPALQAEAARIQDEYNRRPWNRYVLVPGGHVHSGVQCAGGSPRPTTERNWFPQLSGSSIEEAIAKIGETMCTHCFPDAPVVVSATKKAAAAARCAGTGHSEVRGTYRLGTPPLGQCQECGTYQVVTSRGLIRAHRPSK